MKIYDMHIHAKGKCADKSRLLGLLSEAGIWGGSVFSPAPREAKFSTGMDFFERIALLHSMTDGEDRLFPILWVHPDELFVKRKIRAAAREGVRGFKVICNNFFPYEKKSLRMLSAIADEGVPVIFHSGILWNGAASSQYNRPLNFEPLIDIDGLRFSMGHCSWPWVDECIALYGKFLNGITTGKSAEMFFDLTPGTPEIYRRELMTKLFCVGYDVSHNVMFGTDNRAEDYNSEWAKKWLKIDGEIFDSLGMKPVTREKIYEKNYLRFLGVTEKDFQHISPVPDRDTAWSLLEDK